MAGVVKWVWVTIKGCLNYKILGSQVSGSLWINCVWDNYGHTVQTIISYIVSFLDESNPHSGNGIGGSGGGHESGHGHLSSHGHSHHQLPGHMPHPVPHASSAPPLGPPSGSTTSWLFSSPHAPPQPPQALFQVCNCYSGRPASLSVPHRVHCKQ